MADLFADCAELEKLPMVGADVAYLACLPVGRSPDNILSALISEITWRQETIVVWGKRHLQPRLIAWYGDLEKNYTYSGIRLTPLPWTALLSHLKECAEDAVKHRFNSVLLNYYRDNNDSMGFHSDDEPELGLQPVIASLSLGEERTFVLKHKTDKTLKNVRIRLASGSLLLMKGDTQTNWKHAIDKERRPCGPRVNLTFRRILLR